MSDAPADLYEKALRFYESGELGDAAASFETILAMDPNHPDALHMLGVIAYQLGQIEVAATFLEQAVAVRQPFAEAETNFGTVLLALNRTDEAVATLRLAHEHSPSNPVILFNLGNACAANGAMQGAEEAYEKAVSLQPDYAEAWCQLGVVLRDQDKIGEALSAYEHAVKANPDFSQALYNLANVYRDLDRFGDAESTLRRALDVRPDYAMAWNSLGTLLGDMGRSSDALEAFDNAVRFAPESTPYASNRLCGLQYMEGITDERLSEAHTEWYWLHIAPFLEPMAATERSRDPERILKLGFVSPDFGVHPVGFLTAPLFENTDGNSIETHVFSTRPTRLDDALSGRIRKACDVWHRVSTMDDDSLAGLIDSNQIDILVDMSGQTSGHRLGVFARKPAPIQMSWIGYVGTTGLPAMDYITGDDHQIPDGGDQFYGEQALRLPDGYACYAPPDDAPGIVPLPALARGHITFGSLNNPGKLNESVFQSFAEVLKQVANSRLLFRFRGLDDPSVQQPICLAMEKFGVDTDRLDFEGRGSHVEFLETYNRIDIALDPFPYSGGLTTCEALWMGVPTVTFTGQTFAGRHAASHLHAAGYGDLVAQTREGMIDKASALASDVDSLSVMRRSMRDQVRSSPLCDGQRFAKGFEKSIRQAWRGWCAQQVH